jgi:hypothetical protein
LIYAGPLSTFHFSVGEYKYLGHPFGVLHRRPVLTQRASPSNIHVMAHSFLVFDFGGNEEAAQQARHRIEGWKQGFRLDKKLQVKFERDEIEKSAEEESAKPAKAAKKAKSKDKPTAKQSSGKEASKEGIAAEADAKIRLIVRLDFSDHEKLSHQRWVERIPTEEPFKDANPKVVRAGEADFKATSDLFDSLD